MEGSDLKVHDRGQGTARRGARGSAARSLLVGSDNDDYTSAEEFAEIAEALGLRLELIPGAGHINVDSGHGPWAFALDWALAESGAGKAGGSLVSVP